MYANRGVHSEIGFISRLLTLVGNIMCTIIKISPVLYTFKRAIIFSVDYRKECNVNKNGIPSTRVLLWPAAIFYI